MFNHRLLIPILFLLLVPRSELFSVEQTKIIQQNWPFKGFFGRFDQSSIQRGFQVYREVCASCHGIKYISYRDLKDIGYSSDDIKSIASEYEITDGPNDEGEMYERFAKPSDKFVEPFPNRPSLPGQPLKNN